MSKRNPKAKTIKKEIEESPKESWFTRLKKKLYNYFIDVEELDSDDGYFDYDCGDE